MAGHCLLDIRIRESPLSIMQVEFQFGEDTLGCYSGANAMSLARVGRLAESGVHLDSRTEADCSFRILPNFFDAVIGQIVESNVAPYGSGCCRCTIRRCRACDTRS